MIIWDVEKMGAALLMPPCMISTTRQARKAALSLGMEGPKLAKSHSQHHRHPRRWNGAIKAHRPCGAESMLEDADFGGAWR